MTLVDSSCWVDFYQPHGVPRIQAAVAAAIESGEAAICGMIEVEILGFIARKAERDLVGADFAALISLETRPQDYARAVAFGHALRNRGATVPATDLVIAAVAVGHGAVLLHADGHFRSVARHTRLRQRFVG